MPPVTRSQSCTTPNRETTVPQDIPHLYSPACLLSPLSELSSLMSNMNITPKDAPEELTSYPRHILTTIGRLDPNDSISQAGQICRECTTTPTSTRRSSPAQTPTEHPNNPTQEPDEPEPPVPQSLHPSPHSSSRSVFPEPLSGNIDIAQLLATMATSQNLILQLQQQQVLLAQQLPPTYEPINTSYKVTNPFKYTGTD